MSQSNPRIPVTVQQQSAILRAGGGLGIAGCSIGLLVLLSACFGFNFALLMGFVPLAMGAVGLVLAIIGGFSDKHAESSHVAAAIFINFASLAGGALVLWAWQHWPKSA